MGSFMEIRQAAGVGEIGNIWFGRAWQRDIRATEVLSMMMHHVLETRGYRRLEWKCNALNAGSRSAALRLGFRYEGLFLNHLIVKGRSRDTAWFSLTDEEWPAVREAHAQWFAPKNFDAGGRQKTSLSELTRALRAPAVPSSLKALRVGANLRCGQAFHSTTDRTALNAQVTGTGNARRPWIARDVFAATVVGQPVGSGRAWISTRCRPSRSKSSETTFVMDEPPTRRG